MKPDNISHNVNVHKRAGSRFQKIYIFEIFLVNSYRIRLDELGVFECGNFARKCHFSAIILIFSSVSGARPGGLNETSDLKIFSEEKNLMCCPPSPNVSLNDNCFLFERNKWSPKELSTPFFV